MQTDLVDVWVFLERGGQPTPQKGWRAQRAIAGLSALSWREAENLQVGEDAVKLAQTHSMIERLGTWAATQPISFRCHPTGSVPCVPSQAGAT